MDAYDRLDPGRGRVGFPGVHDDCVWGQIPMAELASATVGQWLAKSAYEVAVTPLTYLVVNFLKRKENTDVYDYGMRFNPLLIG